MQTSRKTAWSSKLLAMSTILWRIVSPTVVHVSNGSPVIGCFPETLMPIEFNGEWSFRFCRRAGYGCGEPGEMETEISTVCCPSNIPPSGSGNSPGILKKKRPENREMRYLGLNPSGFHSARVLYPTNNKGKHEYTLRFFSFFNDKKTTDRFGAGEQLEQHDLGFLFAHL